MKLLPRQGWYNETWGQDHSTRTSADSVWTMTLKTEHGSVGWQSANSLTFSLFVCPPFYDTEIEYRIDSRTCDVSLQSQRNLYPVSGAEDLHSSWLVLLPRVCLTKTKRPMTCGAQSQLIMSSGLIWVKPFSKSCCWRNWSRPCNH